MDDGISAQERLNNLVQEDAEQDDDDGNGNDHPGRYAKKHQTQRQQCQRDPNPRDKLPDTAVDCVERREWRMQQVEREPEQCNGQDELCDLRANIGADPVLDPLPGVPCDGKLLYRQEAQPQTLEALLVDEPVKGEREDCANRNAQVEQAGGEAGNLKTNLGGAALPDTLDHGGGIGHALSDRFLPGRAVLLVLVDQDIVAAWQFLAGRLQLIFQCSTKKVDA